MLIKKSNMNIIQNAILVTLRDYYSYFNILIYLAYFPFKFFNNFIYIFSKYMCFILISLSFLF